jgi:hypothetical protein
MSTPKFVSLYHKFPNYSANALAVGSCRPFHSNRERKKAGERARAEAQRSAEQAKQSVEDDRYAKCKSESNGGLHPCGLTLARAYVRLANTAMPHCSNLLQHEWCTIDFARTWVRWADGTKHSRSPIKDEPSLLCDFTVAWDCKVRDPNSQREVTAAPAVLLLCGSFMPARLKAEAKSFVPGLVT